MLKEISLTINEKQNLALPHKYVSSGCGDLNTIFLKAYSLSVIGVDHSLHTPALLNLKHVCLIYSLFNEPKHTCVWTLLCQ